MPLVLFDMFVLGEGQLCCICYATIGIPIFLLCVANISGVLGEMFRFIYGKIICKPCYMIRDRRRAAKKSKIEEVNDIHIEESQPNRWKSDTHEQSIRTSTKKSDSNMIMDEINPPSSNERVAVPLTVTMVIIAAYIWIGSLLFHNFEGWSLMQAGYFCFITLGK
jgi:hypothetical protein